MTKPYRLAFLKMRLYLGRILGTFLFICTLMCAHAHAQNTQAEAPLSHFGQPVFLNGANIAWVNFGFDVGQLDSTPDQLQNEFQKLAAYGGNSARWWLHASGWFSPDIGLDGFVRGISPNTQNGVSDQDMIEQVRDVLDAAWEEGILLTISLFSYDIACSETNNINGSVYRGSRFNGMLNIYYQSYIDNVLTPLVTELRDHPALFAWEIFNEADGMSTGNNFFNDNCPLGSYPQSNEVLQRFVNLAAARIHAIDPNVKVTTSVSQTALLEQYTNNVLTAPESADPTGTLDFYQAHWYWLFGHPSNPYQITAQDRGLDKPIVMGEFGPGTEPASGTAEEDLNAALFEQGYAGAWLWDINGLPDIVVERVVSGAISYSPPIDKTAIEACINSRSEDCYILLPGESTLAGQVTQMISGNDTIIGSNGNDVLDGGDGDDFVSGRDGDDIINGGSGDDALFGGLGANVINGDAGEDTIIGGNEAETLDGGADNDTINGQAGNDTISGRTGDDNLTAGGGNDTVFGNDGDDTLNGQAGDDILNGGFGNDLLIGAFGDDTINGGAGDDSVFAGAEEDIVNGGDGDDTLRGEGQDDILNGDAGADRLFGDAGRDTLDGGEGNDELFGGTGLDMLNGGAGDDILNGGVGPDVLDGGTGNDQLFGQSGADSFVFALGYEADRVRDFEDDVDTIQINADLIAGNASVNTLADILDPANGIISQVNANNVQLEFGNGDVLTITATGITIADVMDDIELVI